MKKVDMSENAILRRLQTVDRLRELCLSLMKAKKRSGEKAFAPEIKAGCDLRPEDTARSQK